MNKQNPKNTNGDTFFPTPMPVRRLLAKMNDSLPKESHPGGVVIPFPQAVERVLPIAASDKADHGPFEDPNPDALFHVYGDDAELYAEEFDEKWVLRLYRQTVHDEDGFTGESIVEQWKEEPDILGCVAMPGLVTVRYGKTNLLLKLDPCEE